MTFKPSPRPCPKRAKSGPSELSTQMGSKATKAITVLKLIKAETFSSMESCLLVITCQVVFCGDSAESFPKSHRSHSSRCDSRPFFRFIFARVQKAMPSSSSSTMVKPFSNRFRYSADFAD